MTKIPQKIPQIEVRVFSCFKHFNYHLKDHASINQLRLVGGFDVYTIAHLTICYSSTLIKPASRFYCLLNKAWKHFPP